jgi:hypothetical protein
MKLHSTIRLAGSVILLLTFALFNIGVPVSFYLCPMMNAYPAECPMKADQPAAGLSIVNPTPDCCGKVVLGDRNTTPFVKAHSPEHEKVASVLATNVDLVHKIIIGKRSGSTGIPVLHSPPVFLLNSSLLI